MRSFVENAFLASGARISEIRQFRLATLSPISAVESLHAFCTCLDRAAVQRFLPGTVLFAVREEVGHVRDCTVCDRRRCAATRSVSTKHVRDCFVVGKRNLAGCRGSAVFNAWDLGELRTRLTLGKHGLSVRKRRRRGRQTHVIDVGTRLLPARQCRKRGQAECGHAAQVTHGGTIRRGFSGRRLGFCGRPAKPEQAALSKSLDEARSRFG